MSHATPAVLARVLRELPGNSCATQRQRIEAALREVGPLTTLQIQAGLDIPRPASRICELRSVGASIVTAWTVEETPAGIPHRFARYAAAPGGLGGRTVTGCPS